MNLRIMCWNIAEGNGDRRPHGNATLPNIAEQIRARSPDLVLLNEVVNFDLWVGGWLGGYVRQAQRIAELAGLPYVHWGDVTRLGWLGHKAVAVLSRYPLASPTLHPVMRGSAETGYGTLETTATLFNNTVHIFSTRFDAAHPSDRIAGIQQAIDLVQRRDPQRPVIFGGDFNAAPDSPEMTNFATNSGLVDVFAEHPDTEACVSPDNPRVDYIFYRGPYRVTEMQQRCPWTGVVSDHPWVFATLSLLLTPAVPVSPKLLTVSVQPYPVPLDRAVTVTVQAVDSATGSGVAGQVEVDGVVVATTNTAFRHTFRATRRWIGRFPPHWETSYPMGVVVSPGYVGAPIDFGFPPV